jgi:hypothetical protein
MSFCPRLLPEVSQLQHRGTILQRYKTGNEKVTDILSDQTIPRFVYSIFNPKILGSWVFLGNAPKR